MTKNKKKQIKKLIWVCVFFLFQPNVLFGQNFTLPIGGEPYVDWTIVNYLDLDSSSLIIDWNGGNYAYNNHNAIDFTLPNFAAMDAGVAVFAAGGGTVVRTHDGEFDRWSRVNPNPGFLANSIRIDHGNGFQTEYLHLKRNSLTVNVGDVVRKGQKIAEVGSSGFSSDPHLHFTVYDEDFNAVETYQNPNFWWEQPLAYAGNVDGVLDSGITDHFPSDTELVERPDDVSSFVTTGNLQPLVVSWSNLHWNSPNSDLVYQLIEPGGSVVSQFVTSPFQIRFGWWIVGFNLPANAISGNWAIRASVNGIDWLVDSFVVVGEPTEFCNGLPVTVDLNLGQTTTAGNDVVLGTTGADDIRGKAGDDTICGMGGADFIHGNSGNDWIDGGNGVDNIRGGQGNDILFAGKGATVGTSSRVFGGTGADTIFGGEDADDLRGGRGDDLIRGEQGADFISGNEDDDTLYGGSGSDTLVGGNGRNDVLFGEAGTDYLNGGGGNRDFCDGGGQSSDIATNCEVF